MSLSSTLRKAADSLPADASKDWDIPGLLRDAAYALDEIVTECNGVLEELIILRRKQEGQYRKEETRIKLKMDGKAETKEVSR